MNQPPYRPLGNRYLVLPDSLESEHETIGGIGLTPPPPDPHKRSFEGTVVARGSCAELAIGAKAVYGEYSGYAQTFDGVQYLVLAENEILMEHIVTPFDGPE